MRFFRHSFLAFFLLVLLFFYFDDCYPVCSICVCARFFISLWTLRFFAIRILQLLLRSQLGLALISCCVFFCTSYPLSHLFGYLPHNLTLNIIFDAFNISSLLTKCKMDLMRYVRQGQSLIHSSFKSDLMTESCLHRNQLDCLEGQRISSKSRVSPCAI